MPIGAFEGGSAAIGDTIYVWGGYDTPNVWVSSTRGQAFDAAAGTWRTVAPLPQALTHFQAVPYEGKVYIFGGYVNTPTANGARDDVWVYDPSSDSFSQLADMPFAVAGHGAAVIGSRAYVVSGMFRQGYNFLEGSSKVFSIDLANPTAGWRNEPDAPVARDHTAAVAIDGMLYLVSGQEADEQYTGVRPDLYRLDPANGDWSRLADMPDGGRGHIDQSTIAWNGRIFVVGGNSNGPAGQNTADEVFLYNPQDDTWSELGTIPSPRMGAAVEIIGDYLYVVGGGALVSSQVWRAPLTIS